MWGDGGRAEIWGILLPPNLIFGPIIEHHGYVSDVWWVFKIYNHKIQLC